jgi:hypothetical protein
MKVKVKGILEITWFFLSSFQKKRRRKIKRLKKIEKRDGDSDTKDMY